MKTSEFIKRVEELGYTVDTGLPDENFIIRKEGLIIARVSIRKMLKIDSFYSNKNPDVKLFEVIFEYSKTPEEEREDIKLTDDEVIYLKYVKLEGYKWLARDESGELFAYKNETIKQSYNWKVTGDFRTVTSKESLFAFIKWSDDEPYSVDELLDNID